MSVWKPLWQDLRFLPISSVCGPQNEDELLKDHHGHSFPPLCGLQSALRGSASSATLKGREVFRSFRSQWFCLKQAVSGCVYTTQGASVSAWPSRRGPEFSPQSLARCYDKYQVREGTFLFSLSLKYRSGRRSWQLRQ